MKYLRLALTATLLAFLVACGSGSSSDSGADKSSGADQSVADLSGVDQNQLPDFTGQPDTFHPFPDQNQPDQSQLEDAQLTDSQLTDGLLDDGQGGDLTPPDDGVALPDNILPQDMKLPDVAIDLFVDPDLGGDTQNQSCQGADKQCGPGGVEQCKNGKYLLVQPCPQGCSNGACTTSNVICQSGIQRCFARSVQVCNSAGTAWVHQKLCESDCDGGLCLGNCLADQTRCNGDKQEICNSEGTDWESPTNCTLGCSYGVCGEKELKNEGNVMTLSGTKVYTECVSLSLNGSITVPEDETLTIYAKCLTITKGSTITLESGATLKVYVDETIKNKGKIEGGSEILLQAFDKLENDGTINSTSVVLRADNLHNQSNGVISGTNTAALYGTQWANDGSHSGVVSVMPPAPLYSSTYPAGGYYNLRDEEINLAWEKPFPSVQGYYVKVGDDTPGPGNGKFTDSETITLSRKLFHPGINRVQIVAVNPSAEVGTYTTEITFYLNIRAPKVSSKSHPKPSEWVDDNAVHFSWVEPDVPDAMTFKGFYYIWDRQADTVPTPQTGTFTTETQLFLKNQPSGVWYLHIVPLDTLGHTTLSATHRQVRIGPDPGVANIAGTITDSKTGQGIKDVHVTLNGGLLHAFSGETGDYTFKDSVPFTAETLVVRVSATGYETISKQVSVSKDQTAILDFVLTPSSDPTANKIELGFKFPVIDQRCYRPMVAVGVQSYIVAARHCSTGTTAAPGKVVVLSKDGQSLHSESTLQEYSSVNAADVVGFDDGKFHIVSVFKCDDNGSLQYGHGWSCLRFRLFSEEGQTLSNWVPYGRTGHSGSPSVLFDDSKYHTYFISYSGVYKQTLLSDGSYSGTKGYDATVVSSIYGDTRQSARTTSVKTPSGHATAFIIKSKSSSNSYLYLHVGGADKYLEPAILSSDFKMVFDGTLFHIVFTGQVTLPSENAIKLISVDGAGKIVKTTIIRRLGSSNPSIVGLALYSNRLLLPYVGSDGQVLIRVLGTDHSEIDELDAGPGTQPNVAVNPLLNEGALVYEQDNQIILRKLHLP